MPVSLCAKLTIGPNLGADRRGCACDPVRRRTSANPLRVSPLRVGRGERRAFQLCGVDLRSESIRAAGDRGGTRRRSLFHAPRQHLLPARLGQQVSVHPHGNRHFLGGRPFIEPFFLIAALGAVTERLRFTTFVAKPPIRQPVLVAKQAASVAVMTNDRFGVGLSPWPEDFAGTGTEWTTREARMEEMIEIIRGVTTGEFISYQRKHDQIPAIQICPAPKRPIPIWTGGRAEACSAARRRLDARRRRRHDTRTLPRASHRSAPRVRPRARAVRSPCDRDGGVHARRREATRRPRHHRMHRRLPQRLREGHDAAATEDRRVAGLRRSDHREALAGADMRARLPSSDRRHCPRCLDSSQSITRGEGSGSDAVSALLARIGRSDSAGADFLLDRRAGWADPIS